MKTHITCTSRVINLPIPNIFEVLKLEVDQLLINHSLIDSTDWTLYFQANFNNGKHILVTKNKLGNYRSDRVKEISIVIPLPLIDVVPWGVEESRHGTKPTHFDDIIHNFWVLEDVDVTKFTSLHDYALDCMRRGIKKAFHEGFTIGGVKIKLSSDISR